MNNKFVKISGKNVKFNLINLDQLTFEVTDICNLKCKYCGYGEYYEGYDTRKNGSLEIQKALNIIDYLVDLWKDNIGLSFRQPFALGFYGGEPLIGINFIKEVIRHVETLHITTKKIHYNMTTNGLLLEKHMDYLVEKEFRLLISLDGNELGHSYRVDHRNKNSHKKLMKNLRLLQQKHPDYFKRFVRFNTVLHNRNSVQSAHNYILLNFEKKTTICQLNPFGIRKDKVEDFMKIFQSKEESIEKAGNSSKLEPDLFLQAPKISQLCSFLYRYSGNMFDNYNSLLIDRDNAETIPTGTCTPFFKKLFVSVNGKILPCENVKHEFFLGRIYSDKVDLNFDQIAEMYNDYVFRFIKQCKTCAYARTCTKCVLQIDDINSNNPICSKYTTSNAFQQYVNVNLDYLGSNPKLYRKLMNEVRIKT